MSGRSILMPMRLTDPSEGPPRRVPNLQAVLAALVLVVTAFSSVAMVHFATATGRAGGLAGDIMAVSARRLAGGPRLPLRELRRHRALCPAEDRLLQLHHRSG